MPLFLLVCCLSIVILYKLTISNLFVLSNSGLAFLSISLYNPDNPKRKEAKTMSEIYESELRFPNLLEDKDFICYSWTLPFAVL